MACAAIIVASGSSRRMGFDKLAASLLGRPVLAHTVAAFLRAEEISRIVVVCPPERFELLAGLDFTKPVTRVDGGEQRHHSVAQGLAALDPADEWVAVHDGARPLIRPEMIAACLAAARESGAATLAHAVTETLKRADAAGYAAAAVDRADLWAMETPQVFRTTLLREAYAGIREGETIVTDEVSVVAAAGVATRLVAADFPNPKITVPADIALAAALLS